MTTTDDATLADTALDATDAELAKLLARGMTYTEAGEVVGLSKAAVYRRMRDPVMRQAVDRARAIGVDSLLLRSISEAEKSITFLAEVRDDDQAPTALRVKAASDLLANVTRWRGQEELPRTAMTDDQARAELVRRLIAIRDRQADRAQEPGELETPAARVLEAVPGTVVGTAVGTSDNRR